jgi:hypothetical protein
MLTRLTMSFTRVQRREEFTTEETFTHHVFAAANKLCHLSRPVSILCGCTRGTSICKREDVAKAFGLLQDGNTDKDEEEVESQVVDFREGEGRCPVVPLVFKTGERFFR